MGLKAQSSRDSPCVLGSLGFPGEKGEKGHAGATGPKGLPVSLDCIMSHKGLEGSHVSFDFRLWTHTLNLGLILNYNLFYSFPLPALSSLLHTLLCILNVIVGVHGANWRKEC